jgi:regulator of chromosome condensation
VTAAVATAAAASVDAPSRATKPHKSAFSLPPAAARTHAPGTLFTFGAGEVGQLGLGEDITQRKKPHPVTRLHSSARPAGSADESDSDADEAHPGFMAVVCGGMHTLALTADGHVLACGTAEDGQLGRRDYSEDADTSLFGLCIGLPDGDPVISISAGDSHSLALTASGHVFITGTFRNESGPFGVDSTPVTKGENATLDADMRSGDKRKVFKFIPVAIPGADGSIVAICSGAHHAVALSRSGTVYTWGCGEQGQLGRIFRSSRSHGIENNHVQLVPAAVEGPWRRQRGVVTAVFTGSCATFFVVHFLTADRTAIDSSHAPEVYACGLNNYSQLGVYRAGQLDVERPEWSALSLVPDGVAQIASAEHHTLALSRSGRVYAIGRGDYGRLGLGSNASVETFQAVVGLPAQVPVVSVACASSVSGAVTSDHQAFLWGMGTCCQTGVGGEHADEDVLTPHLLEGQKLKTGSVFCLSIGGQHTAVIGEQAAARPAA